MIVSHRHYFLTLLLFLMPHILFASSMDELKTLLKDEKFSEAYEMAKSMSEERSGEPDFDFIYGKVARKAGHPEVTIFVLERVLMRNPDDMVSAYERALALLDVHDFMAAKSAFENILSRNADEVIKANARELLELTNAKIVDQASLTDFFLSTKFEIGFNSNINSGTTDLLELDTQGPEVKDGFLNLGLTTSMKRKITKNDSYFFSVASNNRKNFRSSNWDYNFLEFRTGLEFGFGQFVLRIPVEVKILLTNYALVRVLPAFGPNLSFKWNAKNISAVSIQLQHRSYIDEKNNYLAFPLVLQHEAFEVVPGLDLAIIGFYIPSIAYAPDPGPKVKTQLGTKLQVSFEFVRSHFLIPSFDYFYLRYPVGITPNTPRQDHTLVGRLTYEWRIDQHWALCPSIQYYYNTSTDRDQSYKRYQGQVGVRYDL